MFKLDAESITSSLESNRVVVMMASGFSGAFLLLGFTVSALGSVVMKSYWHSSSHLNWKDAQSYCRNSYYTDLATIFKQSDEDDITMQNYYAWIGLYRSYSSSSQWWAWAWANQEYYNLSWKTWAKDEPYKSKDCAAVHYSPKKLYGNNCQNTYFFFCHEEKPNHLKYKFIPQGKNWSEAKDYCRSAFDDLATFRTNQDVQVEEQEFPVWIGLHKDGGTWKWSGASSEYRNWDGGSAQDGGDCVTISSKDKKMSAKSCSSRLPFVCYRDNVILVKENKTWEGALEHCRALGRDLISVVPEDHEYLMIRIMQANTQQVWVGLRFLAGEWLWINGVAVSYPDLPLCPATILRCGVLSKNDTGTVEVADCAERRNFLCYS